MDIAQRHRAHIGAGIVLLVAGLCVFVSYLVSSSTPGYVGARQLSVLNLPPLNYQLHPYRAICQDAELFDSIDTLGEAVEMLGPPETIYYLYEQRQHDAKWHARHALYPSNGVDFVLDLDGSISAKSTEVTDFLCYEPITVEARKNQKEKPPQSASYFGLRSTFFDWKDFDR
jgi:hypothetical protein